MAARCLTLPPISPPSAPCSIRATTRPSRSSPRTRSSGCAASASLRRVSRRRGAVPRRRAGAGDVRRAEGAGRDQPARRLRPAAAAGRAGAGTVPGRGGRSSPAGRRWSTASPRARSRPMLIPPAGLRALLVAEAGLGERITRALILRRVQLIQSGRRRAADHRRRRRTPTCCGSRPSCGATAIRTRSPTRRAMRRRRGCSAIARRRAAGCRWW